MIADLLMPSGKPIMDISVQCDFAILDRFPGMFMVTASVGDASIGSYSAFCNPHTREEIATFLDVDMLPQDPYFSMVFVAKNHRGHGLSHVLAEYLFSELDRRGAAHVAAFSPKGFRSVRPRFLERGYHPIAVRDEALFAAWQTGNYEAKDLPVAGWVAKDWSR